MVRVLILSNVGKTLEIKEHSQIYLYLLIFKDTSKAQNSEFRNSKFVLLLLD